MTGFVFEKRVKHGRQMLLPGAVYGFECSHAAAYFERMGWGRAVERAADYVFSCEELSVDPETRSKPADLDVQNGALAMEAGNA